MFRSLLPATVCAVTITITLFCASHSPLQSLTHGHLLPINVIIPLCLGVPCGGPDKNCTVCCAGPTSVFVHRRRTSYTASHKVKSKEQGEQEGIDSDREKGISQFLSPHADWKMAKPHQPLDLNWSLRMTRHAAGSQGPQQLSAIVSWSTS
jgi:hypothetical protein